jgi:glycosyltransferase involved in cell wall biosynthesis
METEPVINAGDVPVLSVVVCAHNPRKDYLVQVIDALKEQTLAKCCWECLLIDNASSERLENKWDLSWHPHGRHLLQDELGLTAARLLGIRESQGKLLVFVDDDNILAADYLEHALRVEQTWPSIGAWGGEVIGRFETEPEPWAHPYLVYMCIRECKEACWSNNPQDWSALPFGAGLCLRANVAQLYALELESTPHRRILGRNGAGLMSGEDIDMVLFSRKLGLGFGRFPELRLSHLIPAQRLSEDYLVELVRGTSRSNVLVSSLHSQPPPYVQQPDILWSLLYLLGRGRRRFRFHRARVAGIREGRKDLKKAGFSLSEDA